MFLENKYTRWYQAIISAAQNQNRTRKTGNYYESHHIIPKSMGGKEQVLLTAKEHYICHLLLCKMTSGQYKYKMINALIRMAFNKSSSQHRYTAKSYSLVRSLIAEKNRAMFKGVAKSEQTRNNMKGRSGTWKRTEDHLKKLSEIRKGKLIGDDNPARRPEVRQKISDKAKELGNNPTQAIIVGRIKMTENMKNKKWFTNGIEDLFIETCPEGFYSGRSKNRKEKCLATSQQK